MSKKNKIYWLDGVTEKSVKSLVADENSKYRCFNTLNGAGLAQKRYLAKTNQEKAIKLDLDD